MDTDDLGREEIDGLTEHAGFRLNAAHSPSDNTESVDHGRVGVRTDKTVRIIDSTRMKNSTRQIFQVHLVNDADAGRHHTKSFEGLLTPLQKLVALAVAPELHVEVQLHRVGPAVIVDLHGVIHDKVNRDQRLDDAGLPAQAGHRTAHGGEIHQQGNSREVLQNDAGNDERNLLRSRSLGIPSRKSLHILVMDFLAVAVAQDRLQHHADRKRKA
jgi:hypothetical protein